MEFRLAADTLLSCCLDFPIASGLSAIILSLEHGIITFEVYFLQNTLPEKSEGYVKELNNDSHNPERCPNRKLK